MGFFLSAIIVHLGVVGILTISPAPVYSKANLNTLRQAQIIFRHGARTIDQTYPTDPYKNESFWSPGYSQLTNLGKLQGYNLGLYLRERYSGFVKDTYDLKEVYVLSSDLARTIQTASSVMAGFYLPNQIQDMNNITDYLSNNSIEIPLPWKSVPVHNCPVEYDNILRQMAEICPRYYQLYRNFFRGFDEHGKRFSQAVDEIQEYFYNKTGDKPPTIKDTLMDVDTLLTEQYYNLTLPDWTQQLLDEGKATNLLRYFFQVITYTEEMKRLRVGPLLERLVHNMVLNETILKDEFDRARSGQKKMYFFSAHDSTVAGILNTLGIFNKKRPPFTSAVILELHQPENFSSTFPSQQELFVEIYYRNETDNEPYQLHIPGCGLQCPLGDFISLVDPYIPENWSQECLVLTESSALSAGWIVFIVVCVWIILFLLLQFWMRSSCFSFINKKRRQSTYSHIK